MKNLFFIVLIFVFNVSNAQGKSELSNYKYILVPATFSFQDTPHEYNLNRLVQFLFNKYHFEAFIEGEENPLLEKIDPCEILRANASVEGFFKTKVSFSFLDCRGKHIYTSSSGVSSKKEYDKSYTEAIRNVFNVDKQIKAHVYLKKEDLDKPKEFVSFPKKSVKKQNSRPSLEFELRGKNYSFVQASATTYTILVDSKEIGMATQQLEGNQAYTIDAGVLSGTGSFDDFGNFELKRINPASKQELIDIMIRTK